jgi:hypothetical protein
MHILFQMLEFHYDRSTVLKNSFKFAKYAGDMLQQYFCIFFSDIQLFIKLLKELQASKYLIVIKKFCNIYNNYCISYKEHANALCLPEMFFSLHYYSKIFQAIE